MTGNLQRMAMASFLGRADPRLKLLVCGLVIILAFAAGSWQRLAVLGVVALLLSRLACCGPMAMLRSLRPFRWLLLFTLLLHLFLSPGHTLFGVAWLSRDGLLHGLLVCGQIAIAALAAALLSSTTTAEHTALACGWLLTPLKWLGCPVRQWEELTFLVLRFFPQMREELMATVAADGGGWFHRVSAWENRLLPLFDRLVERADTYARDIVDGREAVCPGQLPPLDLLAMRNALLTAGLLAAVFCYAVLA
jgi:energy-coupling factor transport system permease protein